MAVPSASRPMRKTTVLPPRSTPVASAKTFGRPSNTNPITPSGARRRSTRQPRCSTPSMSWSRSDGMSRQVRRPATMSARIRSESTSRVVLRPCSRATETSSALAAAMRANTAGSSNRRANPSKKAVTAVSGSPPSSRKAWWAAVTAASASVWSAAGIRSRTPVSCTTTSRSPGANSRARSVGDPGDPVPAVHDRLARLQPLQPVGSGPRHRQALRTNGVGTTVPASAVPRTSISTAAPSSTVGRQEGERDAVAEDGREVPAGDLPHRGARR